MNLKDTSVLEVKFLKAKLFAIGIAFLISFLITLFDNELYNLLNKNLAFYFISALIYFYLVILLSNVKFQFNTMFRLILITVYVHTIFFCLMHCHYSYAVFLHFIAITIATLIITNYRIAFLILFISSFICFYSRPIAEFLQINNTNYHLNELPEVINKFENITIGYSIFFIFYTSFIYYFLKSKKHKNNEKLDLATTEEKVIEEKNIEEKNSEKFETLYQEILNYFEKEKPYTNPEFSITTLSKDLKTNSTYISKSLNHVGSKKFNAFVNEHRIKQIIEDLNKKKYKNNTLESIYIKAGFTQQSTFNRIFKEHIGLTPSEYIENLEKLKENGTQ